jgi:hypothetical protein
LADGADVIVFAMPSDRDGQRLMDAHRRDRPSTPLLVMAEDVTGADAPLAGALVCHLPRDAPATVFIDALGHLLEQSAGTAARHAGRRGLQPAAAPTGSA